MKARISGLELRKESYRQPARGSNPYWSCKHCGIYDPQLFVQGGEHHKGCQMVGIDKQINYFKSLLKIELE